MARRGIFNTDTPALGVDQRQNSLPEFEGQGDATFTNAFGRGVDTLQASLYSFANVIGEMTGVDTIAEWGEEGVARNMEEILKNPPEVRSWDDVDSLADFGNYLLEGLGEQAPQLLLDAGLFATGYGAGAAMARRGTLTTLQKAMVGKALKRKIGEKGFDQFVQRKVGKAVGTAAFTASAVAQGTGETQMELKEHDVDSPISALLAGSVKGGLDRIGLDRIFAAGKALGVSPRKAGQVVGEIAKQTGLTGATESVTEGLQTITDFVTVKAHTGEDIFSDENLHELKEAMIKGGLIGGTLGGTVSGLSNGAQYLKHRDTTNAKLTEDESEVIRQTVIDALSPENGTPLTDVSPGPITPPDNEKDEPTPESQATIDAQAQAIVDPTSSKDTMEVTQGSPLPSPGILPEDTPVVPTENGLALTLNPDKEEALRLSGGDQPSLGQALYDRPEGKAGTDGTVVVSNDANGIPVAEIVTDETNIERDSQTAAELAPAGGTVEVSDAASQLTARENRQQQETNPDSAPALETDTNNPLVGALREVILDLPPQRRAEVAAVMEAGGPAAQELIEVLGGLAQKKLGDVRPEQSETDLEDTEQDAIRNQLNVTERYSPAEGNAADNNQLVPTLREEQFSSHEEAQKALDKLASDPRIEGRRVVGRGGNFFIEETLLPPELAPEPIVREGRAKAPKGRPADRSESTFIDDAIETAKKAARNRSRFAFAVRRKGQEELAQRLEYSFIDAYDPNGKRIQLATHDLTSAGMDLLRNRQLALDEGPSAFRLAGFKAMLGELAQRGYDISGAFDQDNMPQAAIDRLQQGDISVAKLHPDLYLSTGKFTTGKGTFQTVREAQEQLPAHRSEENTRRLQLEKAAKKGPLPEETGAELDQLRREHDQNASFDPKDIADSVEDKDTLDKRLAGHQTNIKQDDSEQDAQGNRLDELHRDQNRQPSEPPPTEKPHRGIFSRGLNTEETNFVRGVLADLGVENLNFAFVDTEDLSGIGLTTAEQTEVQQAFAEDPNLKGQFIPKGRTGIIVVRPAKEGDNPADRLIVLGHEIGHGVLKAVVQRMTPAQKERLLKAFEEHRAHSQRYQGDQGFIEWFADQTAAWALKLNERPKNIRERLFKQAAQELKKVWNAVKKRLPGAFQLTPEFDEFIMEIKHSRVFSEAQSFGVGRAEKMVWDSPPIGEVVSRLTLSRAHQGLKRVTTDIAKIPLLRHLFTADGQIRALAGDKFADRIYQETSSRVDKESYQGAVDKQRSLWVGQLNNLLLKHRPKGTKKERDRILNEAFLELAQELPTQDLSPLAADIRLLLERFYHQYVNKRLPTVHELKDYFPRVYNTLAIANDSEGFISILRDHGVEEAEAIAKSLRSENNPLSGSDEDMLFVPGGNRLFGHRKFRDPALVRALVDAGYLNSNPFESVTSYIASTVKRGEFAESFHSMEKLFHDINQLELSPKGRNRLRGLVAHSLGMTPVPRDTLLYKTVGQIRAYESLRTLMFSGVASIPEAAAAFARTRGEIGLKEFAQHSVGAIRDYQDLKEFAEAIGAVRHHVSAAMFTEMYGPGTHSRRGLSRALPWMFKLNGNDAIVNYSRVLAASVGQEFLRISAANVTGGEGNTARSSRYLQELGVTAEQVNRWFANGQPTWTGDMAGQELADTEAVLGALNRFIDESVIRPNHSERPSWADHPLGALVFNLKTFAYTYNKNIVMGAMREVGSRIDEDEAKGLASSLGFLLPAVFVVLALGAVSEEMRQRIISLGRRGAWDKARGNPEYLAKNIVKRSGLDSIPYIDAIMEPSRRNITFALGPAASHLNETADHLLKLLTAKNPTRKNLNYLMRATPGLSQMPEIRKMIRNTVY